MSRSNVKYQAKHLLVVTLPIFLTTFVVAATNTIIAMCSVIVCLIVLLFIWSVSSYTDKKLESKFNKIALLLLCTSVLSTFCGIFTYPLQKKLNLSRANEFIAKIEYFKSINHKLPSYNDNIEIPVSINGLYVEKFNYIIDHDNNSYRVTYFDGFWDTRVYTSKSKQWFIDD
ncbi:MAG: hypothetical protein JNJ85_05140 [Candidatus Kapabacteria bacterium]|nr:hypothetical protein [Candidatus Kapabacteria bacterium]